MYKQLLILFCLVISVSANANETSCAELVDKETPANIAIASGAPGGAYDSVANAIKALLDEECGFNVRVVESQGSNENIEKILSEEVKLALVQSDSLYRMIEGGSEPKVERTIASVGALFPEYIQILVRTNSDIDSLLKLRDRRLYLGPKGSGTWKNADDILRFLGMGGSVEIGEGKVNLAKDSDGQSPAADSLLDTLPSKNKDYTEPFESLTTDEAKQALLDGQLDAVFVTSATSQFSNGLRVLGLNQELADAVSTKLPFYSYKKVSFGGEAQNILFVRALLVSAIHSERDSVGGLPTDTVKGIASTLQQNWYKLGSMIQSDFELFAKHMMPRNVVAELHPGANEFFVEASLLSQTTILQKLTVTLLLLICAVIITHNWLMNFEVVRTFFNSGLISSLYELQPVQYLWDKLLWITTGGLKRPFFWLFLTAVYGIALGMNVIESDYAHKFDVENPFANEPLTDIMSWLLTFGLTGFSQDMYPNSPFAKVLAVAIPIFSLLGALFVISKQVAANGRTTERRRRGEIVQDKMKNHILICGWNDRVPAIIKNLQSDYSAEKSKNIVVLADVDIEMPLQPFGFSENRVHYYRGISSSYADLRAVSAATSHCAIVMADDKKILNHNFRSILTVGALRDITSNIPNYRIVAEVHFQENIPYFERQGADSLVCLHHDSVRFLVHAVLNPGVSDLLLNLLSFESPYKLTANCCDRSEFQGRRFKDVVKEVRKDKVQLLAVYQNTQDENQSSLELEFRDRESCPYIIVPEEDAEAERTISADDTLIAISKPRLRNSKPFQPQQKTVFPTFDPCEEKLLILGESGRRVDIINQLSDCFEEIVYIGSEIESISARHLANSIYESHQSVESQKALIEAITNDNFNRVMVVSNEKVNPQILDSIYQDDETLRMVTTLVEIYLKSGMNVPHIAAEIRHMDNKDLFEVIGVNQLIPTNKIVELALSRMVLHGGRVTRLLLKSMSYSAENQIALLRKISVDQARQRLGDKNIIGMTFDELIEVSLENGMQLIGIETVDRAGIKQLVLNPGEVGGVRGGIEKNDNLFYFMQPEPCSSNNLNKPKPSDVDADLSSSLEAIGREGAET